jgi:hypothetical protein
MLAVRATTINRQEGGGATIFILAAMVFILLAISALAIDLGMLYVARSEAQRAADGGALAGAKAFVTSGFLSGAATQAQAESIARQEAIDVAAQNTVGGQAAAVAAGDVTFDFSVPGNPRIQVLVQRTSASGNPMPTLFARALGILEGNVSATAVAEAFSPSGTSVPVGTGCVKPWILPNCDVNLGHGTLANPNCPDGNDYWVDPSGDVLNPGPVASGGVIGDTIIIKPGLPSDAAVPGQFYPIQIPPGSEPALCPDCAKISYGSEGPGGALYRMNIACCNTNQFVCGQTAEVDEQTGNMVGPTNQGVQCLIHQNNQNCNGPASGCGQDWISDPANTPFNWTGGSNNPNPALVNQTITSTDSIVTIPLYDGSPLSPGESGVNPTVTIIGFLQLFVEKVGPPQSTVSAHIINIAGCGGGSSGGGGNTGSGGGDGSGSGSGGPITGPGGSPFPIRLIRPST